LTDESMMWPLYQQSPPLNTQRADYQFGDLRARVLLLAGDQAPVADGEVPEEPALDVVGTAFAELILDPVGHHLLPDRPVDVVLLDVRESGHRLALDEVGAIRQLHVDQRGHSVAEDCGRLLGLIEGSDRSLQVLVLTELEHRRVSTADHDR